MTTTKKPTVKVGSRYMDFETALAELKMLMEEQEAIPRSPHEPPRPGILASLLAGYRKPN